VVSDRNIPCNYVLPRFKDTIVVLILEHTVLYSQIVSRRILLNSAIIEYYDKLDLAISARRPIAQDRFGRCAIVTH